MSVNPLNKIIGLSIILSMGFLLVVLAGIYGNWFPIVVGLIFAVAHLPIAISENYNNYDDFISEGTSSLMDLAKFLSAALFVTGVCLPVLLAHSNILTRPAAVLTIIGGLLIYGTVVVFTSFFDENTETFEI